MAVLPMQKIQILGMKKNLPAVLDFLQTNGMMQVEEVSSEEELENMEKADHDHDLQIAQLDFAIKFLKAHAPKRPIWLGKPSLSMESAIGTLESSNYKELIKDCQKLEESYVADQNEQVALDAEKELLIDWKDLPFDLNTPRETDSVKIFTGMVATDACKNFKKELHTLVDLSGVERVGGKEKDCLVAVVVSKKYLDEAKVVFGRFKFQEVDLPVHEMSVSERISDIDHKQAKLAEKMIAHVKNMKKLAKNSGNLQIVHDVFVWKRDSHDLHDKLQGTTYSFIVEGWIPKQERKSIEAGLQEISPQSAIEAVKPKKDEQTPIMLRNNKAILPFETITRLYGLPGAKEVDPTQYLSIFYITFFAICLTDAGYGLVLFLVMASALKFMNLPPESKGMVKLLMWGGILTMFAGVLFGGYFGITPEQAPAFMVAENGMFKGQVLNAVSGSGTIIFLKLALYIGVAHMVFANMLDGYWKIKTERRYLDALLDNGFWIYFILVLTGAIMAYFGSFTPETAALFYKGSAIGAIAMILTQGRKSKGIGMKVFYGFGSLYGVVGYLGDILSYSRLMALGLATGVIAFAMNRIAGLAIELIPVVGILVAIMVILLGHTMNLVLATLGAFIHSARLQFVEFFGKFMEGGGKEFKPFKRSCKYIIIK